MLIFVKRVQPPKKIDGKVHRDGFVMENCQTVYDMVGDQRGRSAHFNALVILLPTLKCQLKSTDAHCADCRLLVD